MLGVSVRRTTEVADWLLLEGGLLLGGAFLSVLLLPLVTAAALVPDPVRLALVCIALGVGVISAVVVPHSRWPQVRKLIPVEVFTEGQGWECSSLAYNWRRL